MGSFPGHAAMQPKSPPPPWARPAISRLAQIENTVSSVGSAIKKERQEWLDKLESAAVLRVNEEVVHSERKRKGEKHDEHQPPIVLL
jgi:hypothetical protein